VQDALDEIEYITGDPSTTWGARRAQDGHPAPFHLEFVEIGNEDWNSRSDYDGRFAQFFDAIKAKYPALKLIATADVKTRTPDVMDEHYYHRAPEFYNSVHLYDGYDRKGPKIFVGEWATTDWPKPAVGLPTPNLNAALGDAAWMTGMERNSDLVIMQAYAPLLANVNRGGYQWPTNLIGYDALKSYGSPSYYAQVMFNAHRGDAVVEASPGVAPGFFTSVTRDTRTGALYIKGVNSTAAPLGVRIELAGVKAVGSRARQWLLAGKPTDANSLESPEKIVPVESAPKGLSREFEHAFPAFSITVLQLQTR
jgi:alpha-N-arabinofuranosidase